MLAESNRCQSILVCPVTGAPLSRRENPNELVSEDRNGTKRRYPLIDGKPVLIDFERSVVSEHELLSRKAGSAISRPSHHGPKALIKRLLSPQKPQTRRNVARLRDLLRQRASTEPSKVLIVAGGTVGQGMGPLYEDPAIEVYAFDIYGTPLTQFVADAHSIPVATGTFDAVVIQAVLEHVLEPAKVVSEIWRVLKFGGIVYAETPFMQHVHEGAYDFTRFTESGHRYLFRNFYEIASGVSGGPGLQFMWAVDYFVRSLFRSRVAGKVAKLSVFWAQYLDALIPEEYATDAASGTYFMGAKSDTVVTPREAVLRYRGAQ